MMRNKEEDGEDIVETYFGCGVLYCGVKQEDVYPSAEPPGLFIALTILHWGGKGLAARTPVLWFALLLTSCACPCCFRGKLKQLPPVGCDPVTPQAHFHVVLSSFADCADFLGPHHQHWEAEHKVNHREQVKQLLTPSSHPYNNSCMENKVLHIP